VEVPNVHGGYCTRRRRATDAPPPIPIATGRAASAAEGIGKRYLTERHLAELWRHQVHWTADQREVHVDVVVWGGRASIEQLPPPRTAGARLAVTSVVGWQRHRGVQPEPVELVVAWVAKPGMDHPLAVNRRLYVVWQPAWVGHRRAAARRWHDANVQVSTLGPARRVSRVEELDRHVTPGLRRGDATEIQTRIGGVVGGHA